MRSLSNYGVAAFQKGEMEMARRLFTFADDIYQSSYEYSGYPIALSYLALYDVQDGAYILAAQRIHKASEICRMIGSPWWWGVMVYITWRIRLFLEERGKQIPELSALWPASRREHCLWGLSFLRQLQPRLETEELENTIKFLEREEGRDQFKKKLGCVRCTVPS